MYKLFTSLLIFFCSIICFGQHPNNLQSTNITSSSVELSWDDSSCSAATWLRFREAGTSSWIPASAPYISIYDGDTILSGLQPGTQYQWRVKCAGTSGWSNIEGFTTLSGCNITTTTSITNTLCDNFFDGSASITVSNGHPPFSFLWSNNDTSSTITNVTNGVYTVTTTDSLGCFITDSVIIGADNNINMSQSISDFIDTTNPNFPNTVQSYNVWVWDTLRLFNYGCNVNVRPDFIISHESSPIQQGDIQIRWLSPFGYAIIPYNINNNGQAYGFWSTASNDSTGIIANAFSTNEILLKVRFINPAPYGKYTAIWSTNEVDNSGNIIQNVTQNDTATLSLISCNSFELDSFIVSQVNCNSDSSGSISINSMLNGSGNYSYSWTNDSTPQNIISTTQHAQNLPIGNYTCVITDDFLGCSITENFVITASIEITVTPFIDNVSCFGENDGRAVLLISGGQLPYGISWGGYNSDSLAAGVYTYTVIDAIGCVYIDSVVIIEPNQMISGLNYSDITNCISDNGFVDLNPSGGPGSYYFNWSNGATSEDLQNLSAGLYSVIISSDMNNNQQTCIIEDSVQIQDYISSISTSLNSPSINGFNIACFGGSDGIILSNTNNYVGGLTYAWSNSATSQNINNAQAGNYQLIVTDSLGCSDTANIILTQSTDTFEVAYTSNNISCFGINDGSASININGGISGSFLGDTNYIVIFQSDTTVLLNPDTSYFTSTNLSAGTYYLSVTDLAGCVVYDTINILGANQLNLNLTSDTICCNGGTNGSINAQLSGGIGPFTYDWTGPNGPISGNNSTLNSIGSGNYFLNVTDGNGCITQNSIFVNENLPISASVASNNVSCLGGNDGSLSINVNGGTGSYNYTWSNSNGIIGGNNSSLNNLFADTYTCNVNSVGCFGCSENISVIISEPNTPLITNYNQNNISCFGNADGLATINFSGGNTPLNNGDTSYILIFDGNINIITHPTSFFTQTNLGAGNYTYSIEDNNGCTIFDVIPIIEPNPITINFDYDTICCDVTNTGNILSIINGGTPNYLYSWIGPNNFTSNDSSLFAIPAGSYELSITDQNGCSKTDSITLNQNADLIVVADSIKDISCKGDNSGYINILATGGDGMYFYQWYDSNWTIINNNNSSINNLTAGTYYCIVSDNCGCIDSISIPLEEPLSMLSSTYTQTNVSCYGQNDGGATVYFFGGTTGDNPGDTNYILGWEGNTYTLLNPIDSFVTPIGVPPGVYPYSATDINGCVTYDTITITEPDTLNFTYSTGNGSTTNGYDIDCFGNATQLNITAIGGSPPFNFSLDNSVYSPDPISFTFNPVFAGNHIVSIIDNRGCMFDTTISLSEPTILYDSLTTINNSCNGSCDGLIISNIQGGVSPYLFIWNNLQNSSIDTNIIGVDSNLCAGNYTLTIIDQNNCVENLSTTIYEPNPLSITVDSIIDVVTYGVNDGAIYITANGGDSSYTYSWIGPNGFTSNNDDIIDLYTGIYQLNITDSNLCVYNEIFEIIQPSSLWISVDSIKNTLCHTSCEGLINITANGGDSSYTYSWIGPNGFTSNNDDINLLCAGQYIVTVDDSISILVDTFNIYEPQPINTNLIVDSILCYNGQTQAQINVWGGTQPYSYSWSNGDNNFFTTLNAGNHNYTIIDHNGCSYSTTFYISNADSITLQASITNPSCNGFNNGEVIIDITNGGTQPFNFLMTGNSNIQSSNSFNGLSQGNYNYVVTDINGCQNNILVTLSDPPILSSIISSTDVSCYGYCDGSGNITGLGGTSPYTYLWDNGANNLCAGLHNVIITDANGCINTNSIIINEPDPLLINIWNINDTLQATSGFITYQWNYNNVDITAANDSIYIASLFGDYYVTVSDTNGCYADSYVINYSLLSLENSDLNIRIYPNPSNGNIIIESRENINSISLFNTYGNQLYSVDNNQYITNKIKLDLSKFAKGVYFVKININDRIINERIILQ